MGSGHVAHERWQGCPEASALESLPPKHRALALSCKTRHQHLCARGHGTAPAWGHCCATPGPAQACTWACLCSLYTWTNPSLFCAPIQPLRSATAAGVDKSQDPPHHLTQEGDAPGRIALCVLRDMSSRLGLQPCISYTLLSALAATVPASAVPASQGTWAFQGIPDAWSHPLPTCLVITAQGQPQRHFPPSCQHLCPMRILDAHSC